MVQPVAWMSDLGRFPSDLTSLGRYELLRELKKTSAGRVILAKDPRLQRQVLIKLMEPEAVDPEDWPELRFMFHREARATAVLQHPNIVEIFDYSGPNADVLFLASEYIEGPTLSQVFEQHGALPASFVAALGYEITQALVHAHSAGILHRDLKPENVIWTPAGRVVLCEFGIAKAMAGAWSLATYQFGQTNLYGSPAYLAPEVLNGEEASPASDLFALGAVLFEALCGDPVFSGQDVESILDAVQKGRRNTLPENKNIPPRFRMLIDELLFHEVTFRSKEAALVAGGLRDVLDEIGVTDPRRLLAQPLPTKAINPPVLRNHIHQAVSQPEVCVNASHNSLLDGPTVRLTIEPSKDNPPVDPTPVQALPKPRTRSRQRLFFLMLAFVLGAVFGVVSYWLV